MPPVEIAPHLIEALSIFKDEFKSQYDFLAAAGAELEQAAVKGGDAFSDWIKSKLKLVENRFHTIKGSAGFLGLTEIRDLAQQGEKIFKPASPLMADPQKLNAEFGRIIEGLKQALAELG